MKKVLKNTLFVCILEGWNRLHKLNELKTSQRPVKCKKILPPQALYLFFSPVILSHKTLSRILHLCHLQSAEEARKNGLVGNPALAPALISMATRSVWTPSGAVRPAVVLVTQSCRMACVCPGSSAAADTTTPLPLVRTTSLLVGRLPIRAVALVVTAVNVAQ